MLLEEIGFRFIEMVYAPEFGDLASAGPGDAQGLEVVRAGAADLAEVVAVAGAAFRNERFHVDPRLSSQFGDLRYQNWVRSSLDHPTQRLYVLREDGQLVAFFVTELLADGTCYWHLNAVAPARQGQGYGMHAWKAMMYHARVDGASRVRTSIVARNHRCFDAFIVAQQQLGARLRRFRSANMCQNTFIIQHTLDQHFNLAAASLAAEQARRDYAGIVKDQQIARVELVEQIGESTVRQLARWPIQ